MEVQIREKCEKCSGSGIVDNPAWWAADTLDIDLTTMEQQDEYFKSIGYEKTPEQEFDCDNCCGDGMVTYWVPVEVGKAGNIHLRK